jgi:phosphatidylcholine synthase
LAVTIAWSVCAALAIYQGLEPAGWIRAGLLATALYFLALPFTRHSFWAEE